MPTARVFPVLVGDGSVLATPGVLMVKTVPLRANAVEVVQSLLAIILDMSSERMRVYGLLHRHFNSG